MKITNVEGLYLRLPKIQARTDSSQDALLVRVSTDAGIIGWGEVDACPLVVKAIIDAPVSHTLVSGLRSLLLGQDPLDTDRLWQRMYEGTLYYGREGVVIQAMAGVDLALWDIKGKALGQPVYRLLGGGSRTSLRVYASHMFQETPEATAKRARRSFARRRVPPPGVRHALAPAKGCAGGIGCRRSAALVLVGADVDLSVHDAWVAIEISRRVVDGVCH